MNALTGNKAFRLIFRSIDMDALTGNFADVRRLPFPRTESPA
jgi:hypothetical protein